MAPAFRSQTTTTYASRSNTSLTPPAGIADGDIIELCLFFGGYSLPTLTPPAGFTPFSGSPTENMDPGNFVGRYYKYWKRASGESGNYTFTHDSANTQGKCTAYSGAIASGNPYDGQSANANFGQISTGTGFTTTVPDTLLVWDSHDWEATGALTAPSGMTERFDHLIYSATQVLTAAGPTGNRTQTNGNTTNGGPYPWAVFMSALKPPADADTWDDADVKTWDENDGQSWNLSGISVSPTGQQLSLSLGTVLVSGDAPINVLGQQISVVANDVTVSGKARVPVTGQFVTLDVGDVDVYTTSSANIIPNSVIANVFLGDVIVRTKADAPVTGVSATLALGNVTVELKTLVPVDGFILDTRLNFVEATGDANVYVTGEAAYVFDGFVAAKGGAISTAVGEALLVGLGDVAVRTSVNLSVAGFQLDADLGQAYFGGWSPTIPADEPDELHEQWNPINGGNQEWGPVIGGSEQSWIPIYGGAQDWTEINPPTPKPKNDWIEGVIPHGQ